jgi:two-component system sensor histidine kinase ChiS
MIDSYRYLLAWNIRLNALVNSEFRVINLFILGFFSSPLLFFSIQPLFDFFILKKGKQYALHEKSRIGTSFAVLFFFLGLGLNLLPVRGLLPVAGAYLFQSLGLAAFEIFLFFTLYLADHEEKARKVFFISLIAAGFILSILPVVINVPSFWFLGAFSLAVTGLILFSALKRAGQKENYLAYLVSGAEVFLMALSFFIPLTALQILFFAGAILFFQVRGERLFSRRAPAPAPVEVPAPLEAPAHPEAPAPVEAPGESDEDIPVLETISAAEAEAIIRNGEQDLPGVQPELNEKKSIHKPNPFIPREFLDIIGKENVGDLRLNDHVEQEMTIFFSDIRDFTSLLEDLTPEESFKFINSYLTRIVPVIEMNGGFVDKYVGDAIMALFPDKNGPDQAVRTAIEIQKRLVDYNEQRKKYGYRPIAMGIGIHTGEVMLGVVGVYNRMQNTVFSDSVNLASRVESLTKAFNVSMAISGQTFQGLEHPESYMFRYLGNVRVKGKRAIIQVFEVLDETTKDILEKKMRTDRYFQEGLMSFMMKN